MSDIERLYTSMGRARCADLRDLHHEALRSARMASRIYRRGRFPATSSLPGTMASYWIDRAGFYRRQLAEVKRLQAALIGLEIRATMREIWRRPS